MTTDPREATVVVQSRVLGPAGTGGKGFLGACLHSNGRVYVGTYGPPPVR